MTQSQYSNLGHHSILKINYYSRISLEISDHLVKYNVPAHIYQAGPCLQCTPKNHKTEKENFSDKTRCSL